MIRLPIRVVLGGVNSDSITSRFFFLLFPVFILCWSPYIVFDLLQVYGYIPNTQANVALASFIQSLAPLNSAANPIIYCLFSTHICRSLRYSVDAPKRRPFVLPLNASARSATIMLHISTLHVRTEIQTFNFNLKRQLNAGYKYIWSQIGRCRTYVKVQLFRTYNETFSFHLNRLL